jgi:CubicO group peptidase (beta-lactamase class C family)
LLTPAQLQADSGSAPAALNGLDGFVEQVMKDWKVPGLAVAVVKDGKVVYAKGFGYRDVRKQLKVTPDTLFAIGSCSKSFTATALAILADEGKVEWDKPVRDYLPDFRLHDAYATANIRPRDLVTHQSGLPRHDLVWYGSPLSRKGHSARYQQSLA